MFSVSERSILLKPSNDYRRFLILLFIFFSYVVIQSDFPIGLAVFFVLLMFYCLGKGLQQASSYFDKSAIHYKNKSWVLDLNHKSQSFSKAHILLRAGIFMIVRLERDGRFTNLPVFYDQLTEEERRILSLLTKVR